MLLIIGGEGAGKRTFAQSLGYSAQQMADAVLDDSPVLYHLEQMVRNDPDGAEAMLPALLQKEAVLCNEVGSGVIPVTAEERRVREMTGRLCILLAQRADAVVRMVCGIPVVIKGELPCR